MIKTKIFPWNRFQGNDPGCFCIIPTCRFPFGPADIHSAGCVEPRITGGIGIDPEQTADPYRQTSLLQHIPHAGCLAGLPDFHETSGQCQSPGFIAPFDQHDPPKPLPIVDLDDPIRRQIRCLDHHLPLFFNKTVANARPKIIHH